MRNWLLASAAIAATATLSLPARAASDIMLIASGAGISATMVLTYEPTDPQGPLGQPSNTNYPVDSYVVTGITGTFTDMNTTTPIVNAQITGMVPLTFEGSRDNGTNLLAPPSLSFIPATVFGSPADLSYDNLFFPNGSPQSATDYPFSGGFVDIYGLGFTLAGGYTVNFFSMGNNPGVGSLIYGAVVVEEGARIDNQYGGIGVRVPEPASMLLLGAGLLGLAGVRRRQGA